MKSGSPDQGWPGDKAKASWDASDPLWRLLGESARPEPDAWFAARTLARLRNEAPTQPVLSVRRRLVQIWRWALAGGLAASMAVVLMMSSSGPTEQAAAPDQQSVQEAFQIVASMDNDSDSSSTSSWQDSSR